MAAVRGARALALAIVGVLVAAAALFALAAPASAAVGDVTGTVTSIDGTPVPVGSDVYLSTDLDLGGLGPSGPMFASASPVATTGPGGGYTIPGVTTGDYIVLVDAGDDWVQGFALASVDGGADPGAADVDIQIEKGVLITGTVRPEADPSATLDGIAVGAVMECGCGGFFGDGSYFDLLTFDWDLLAPLTPLGGVYRIVVPLDETYEVNAFDPSASPLYAEQSWDHLPGSGGCGCSGDYTPIVTPADTLSTPWPYSPYSPTSAVDFDLVAYADYLWFQVQTVHAPGSTAFPGVHVYLQYDSGGGSWADVADGVTDSSGYVDLYATADGDYRLRFTIGGHPVAVLDAVDAFACGCATPYLLDEGDTKVVLGAYAKSSPGDGYFEGADAEVKLAAPSSGGGGGTSGTPAPRTPTRSTPTFSPASLDATPAPTPTPSATPSPTSSPTTAPQPTPSATSTPAPEPAAASAGPWWIWLLIALLVLGIVITVIVIVRRR